ncbi:hypothetical protein KC322_g9540 [Hortaea werneckii]|nr:hypothetical protein KC322_g9540 [Hortaea werneckii]
MIWARLGGGVVPVGAARGGVVAASVAGVSEDGGGGASPITTPAGKSGRLSLESIPERRGGGDGVAEGGQKADGGGGGGGEEGRQDHEAVQVVEAKTDVPELVAQPTPQHSRRRSSVTAAAAVVDQSAPRASPVVLATSTPEASSQPVSSAEPETEAQARDGGEGSSVETPQLASESTSRPEIDGHVEQDPEPSSSKDLASSAAVEGESAGTAVEESPTDQEAPRDDRLQTAPPPESPRPDVEAEDTARSRGEEMSHEGFSNEGDEPAASSSQPSVVLEGEAEQGSATSPIAADADAVQDLHLPPTSTPIARADDAVHDGEEKGKAASAAPSAGETPEVPIINEPEPSPPLSSPPQQQLEAGGDVPPSTVEDPPSQPQQQEQEQEQQQEQEQEKPQQQTSTDPPPASAQQQQQPDSLPTTGPPQTETEPRRPSGVMARVKAMEAKAQAVEAEKAETSTTKLPGAFE